MPSKKRIAVCSHSVPFTTGGLELFAGRLVAELNAAGYEAEWVRIPFSFGPLEKVVPTASVWRTIELKDISGNPPDVAICLSFPAYLVDHPNKILWLCHQHRAAYDLFGTSRSNFQDDPSGRYHRDVIRRMDDRALAEVRAFFTISRNVASRLEASTGRTATPLWIPPLDPAPEGNPAYDGFALHVGRITGLKRPDLVLRAVSRSRARAVFAGTGDLEPAMKALARELGIAERVHFTGFVTRAELNELYRTCSAVIFTPVDEDYGLISIEALMARKPVISCVDSGGALELIEHEKSALICPADPEALGAAIERLTADPALCRRFGEEGFRSVAAISWPAAIRTLSEAF